MCHELFYLCVVLFWCEICCFICVLRVVPVWNTLIYLCVMSLLNTLFYFCYSRGSVDVGSCTTLSISCLHLGRELLMTRHHSVKLADCKTRVRSVLHSYTCFWANNNLMTPSLEIHVFKAAAVCCKTGVKTTRQRIATRWQKCILWWFWHLYPDARCKEPSDRLYDAFVPSSFFDIFYFDFNVIALVSCQ